MDILIWGCNRFSAVLYQHLKNSSIRVCGFVDERGRTEFMDHIVYSPTTIPNKNFPIVIALDHYLLFNRPLLRLKNINEFKSKLLEIHYDYQIENPLLHPAALVEQLELEFPNKIILFGLQGSGNVIFVNILQSIYKKLLPFLVSRSARTLFFEIMCREYMNLTHQVVSDLVHLNNGHDVRAVAWKLGTSHFNCRFGQKKESQIYSFNTREHIFSYVSMYHQIPSLAYLKKLRTQKFKLYFVLRNPLDVILSGVNKTGGISETMDTELFKCVSRWVIDQLNEWYPLLDELTIIRYENLLMHPIRTIKSLMKFPSTWLAKRIWRQHAFKQLPHAFKSHFWKGGRGKWEQYFKEEHLAYLKAYGIEEVLMKYQYEQELARFRSLCNDTIDVELENYPKNFYRDEHYDTLTFLQQTNDPSHCYTTGLLHLVCDNTSDAQALLEGLNSCYVTKVVLAGEARSGLPRRPTGSSQ